jgi:hypothetical protein
MQVNMDELGADIAKYRRKEAESSTGDDGGGLGNGLKVFLFFCYLSTFICTNKLVLTTGCRAV